MYVGKESGLQRGSVYEVFDGNKKAGEIKVRWVDAHRTVATVEPGTDLKALEGRTVTLRGTFETLRPAPKIEIRVPTGEEQIDGPIYDEKAAEEPEAEAVEEKTTSVKDTEEKKTKKKKKVEKKKEKKESEKKKKKSRRESKRDVPPSVSLPTEPVSERGNGRPISVETPRKASPIVFSNVVRAESHSADTSPDYSVTGVVSATKRVGKSLRTLYLMYKNDFEDRHPDSVGGGLSYTCFLPNAWYWTGSFNYQTIKGKESGEDYTDKSDMLFLGLYKMMGLRTDKPDYWRAAASYSVNSNFRTGESYSGTLVYYHKIGEKKRYSLSYRYTYSVDRGEQLYNQWGADYSFPAGKRKKLTLGYVYVDKVYDAGPGLEADDDHNFRAIWYSVE